MADKHARTSAGEAHSYLLTRSSLDDYLTFMGDYAVGEDGMDRGTQANAWKVAAARMAELQESEAEKADQGEIAPLTPSQRALTKHVEADPIFQRAFNDATYEIALVNLDQVIISQKLVSLKHIRRLQEQLGRQPTPEALFKFCLPYDRQPPPHRASRIGDAEFAFLSESNDLRFQEAVLLKPEQIKGFQAMGPIAGVVALVVGYGSNYLNVLSVNGRLVLNNGNHRACALWQMGLRQVPCIVQTITHPDELEVHAPRAVRRSPSFYLTEPRPPLLGDYFDPVLSRTVQLALTSKQVRLEYSVEEKDMP